jgi:hypothetical protein
VLIRIILDISNQYKLHRLITNQFYLFKHLKIALGDHPPPKMERLPQFRSSGSTSNWSFYCKDKPFQTISLSFSQIIVGSLPPSGTQCQILCVFPNLVAKVSPLPSPHSNHIHPTTKQRAVQARKHMEDMVVLTKITDQMLCFTRIKEAFNKFLYFEHFLVRSNVPRE